MSAPVLLNLLNKLGKNEKMQVLSSILSFFSDKFNKFNNTREQMFESIYHMSQTFLKSGFFLTENFQILSYIWDVVMTIIT